jgi:nucleotide-binding universal stress UspA family protein
MFKTVIWATDGSEAADLALPYVKSLATETGAAIVVVHVEETFVGRAGGYPLRADAGDIVAKIESQVEELSGAGVNARKMMLSGHAGGAAHRIAEAAQEADADLIVVGTRGHTAFAGLLLGSVTQRLLHVAPCPVLAIPGSGHSDKAEGSEAEAATA